MDMVEPGFDPSSFSKNRQRLIEADIAKQLFFRVVECARQARLLSHEHFTVDGTLIEAWASLESFKKKDAPPAPPPDDPGNPTVNFHGEKRSNETHASTTDPEARLARKSQGTTAKLSYSAHSLMENRNGLLVDFRIAAATGTAERQTALTMVDDVLPGHRRNHGRRRQGLRHEGAREGLPRSSRYSSRRTEHFGSALGHRCSHLGTPRFLGEPADSKARRGDLRLDEDDRWLVA